MTAFIVLSTFLSIIYENYCDFYISFCTNKFHSHKFITGFFVFVKIIARMDVILRFILNTIICLDYLLNINNWS